MSPRAAARLETLGFVDVYDYVAGKADWGAAGLPLEGMVGPWAGAIARRDVPTARLREPLQEARTRTLAAEWELCVVLDEAGVVLGRLGRRALRREDDVAVEDAMSEGPVTVRPSLPLARAAERMRRRDLMSLLVTTSDGRLVGALLRHDVES